MRSRRFPSVTSSCANRARVRWPRCGGRPPRRARAGRGCARDIPYTRARLPGHQSCGVRSSSPSSPRSVCSRSAPDCSSARSLCRSARRGMPRSRRAHALVTRPPHTPHGTSLLPPAGRALSPLCGGVGSGRHCSPRSGTTGARRRDFRKTCAALGVREHHTKHASPSLAGCGAVESELEPSSVG